MKLGKVEKGIPIPENPEKQAKYHFERLQKVGDSVLILPDDGQPLAKLRTQIGPASSYYASRHGVKFCTRTMDGGIRVWRIQ